MNYKKIYEDFITDRKTREPLYKRDGSSEKHHIIPKSLGGSNSKENIVRLKTSEHLFAHLLLAKIYGGKMWNALFKMLNGQQIKYTNKSMRILFEKSRKEYSANKSKSMTGLKRTKEFKEKLSKRMKGENNPMFGKEGPNKGKVWSKEIKKKQSDAKIGIKNPMFGKTHNRCKGQDNPRYGVTLSEEQKQKQKESLKKTNEKKLKENPIICPHCKKIGINEGVMKRFHFDNCKNFKS